MSDTIYDHTTRSSDLSISDLSDNNTEIEYDTLVIHRAKRIVNWCGFIYNNSVVGHIKVNDIVRISYHVEKEYFDMWSHDAPYVKILKIQDSEDGTICLGEVQDINRQKANKYIIRSFEKIWFYLTNIIEIPTKYNENSRIVELSKFLSDEKVPVTGPLFTIVFPKEPNSDTESESQNSPEEPSDSDSQSDVSFTTQNDESITTDADTLLTSSFNHNNQRTYSDKLPAKRDDDLTSAEYFSQLTKKMPIDSSSSEKNSSYRPNNPLLKIFLNRSSNQIV